MTRTTLPKIPKGSCVCDGDKDKPVIALSAIGDAHDCGRTNVAVLLGFINHKITQPIDSIDHAVKSFNYIFPTKYSYVSPQKFTGLPLAK